MAPSLATIYFAGKKYSLGISAERSSTYFGGPGYDEVIEGPRYGPRRLHHILTIKNSTFSIPGYDFGFVTSFYYGICFEGCTLKDVTAEEIKENLYNTAWTIDPEKLYLAVPNSAGLGLSLWPPGEEVEIVFEYDPKAGIIRASNQAY